MTNQQMQYAYWQRMRQHRLYSLYAAGAVKPVQKNSYDKIAKVSDNCFLNYLEYSAKNLDSQKAADYLKQHEDPTFAAGRCTGVYEKNTGKVLRQLDWYYNNEAEFIVKIKADPTKDVYSSIGVTAASPKMTKDIAEHYITTGQYYDYFDVLPFFTVDGVNENHVFAQSNVVMKNGVEIDIKKEGATNLKDCCIVMVVRYILDHFTKDDLVSATAVHDKLFNNLHIYGTTKLAGYNSHILVAHYDAEAQYNKSYVIEFEAKDIVVNEFPMIANFRTFKYVEGVPQPIETANQYKKITPTYWTNSNIESNGIGIERWNTASDFLSAANASTAIEDFKRLREKLDYTHAYDRPFERYKTWLTDNLSGDLTIEDMKAYHENPATALSAQLIEDALAGYESQFEQRSRSNPITWITTHGAIYDLVNLSCNIKSQMTTDEATSWNVMFDGQISAEEYQGLCFTAEEENSTVMLQNVNGEYQTSTNGQSWKKYELGHIITLAKVGDKVYFAAKDVNNTCWENHENQKFVMTGKIAASGNIQSLLDKQCQRTDVPDHCYMHIFANCTSLTTPPELPATTLDELCYYTMFIGCTSLITAPKLPAAVLVSECYKFMFKDCSSLTAAPELPAMTLASGCYDTMFENCSSLSSAPTLSSESLCSYCYANMFKGCTNLKISQNESIGNIVLDTTDMSEESLAYDNVMNMFEGTGGTFQDKTPTKGNIYHCYQ